MVAWALWAVHCTASTDGTRAADCWNFTPDFDTQAEAHKDARRSGWVVGKRGEPNICPACQKVGAR